MISADPESPQPDVLNATVPPGAIAWTPIQPITCCIPAIGHMGITDSKGYLHDWHGCPISANHPKQMLFGEPSRYVRLVKLRTTLTENAGTTLLNKLITSTLDIST